MITMYSILSSLLLVSLANKLEANVNDVKNKVNTNRVLFLQFKSNLLIMAHPLQDIAIGNLHNENYLQALKT